MVSNNDVNMSVVIPVFNEGESIPHLAKSLKFVLDSPKTNYEIIFVDDGSTDNSFALLKSFHEDDEHIKIIKFRRNFGQTAALSAGFEYAKGEIIITMDADLQNDPEDIPLLLKKINEGYDVVSGWRADRKDPLTKKISSKFSNWLARKLTGIDIHDFGCTFKAYKRECIDDLELYGEVHRYIPALVAWKGFKVGETKVKHHPRKYGKTKYNIWRLLKGFLDLINIKFWTQYSTRPLHFFGILGIIQFLVGFLIGVYLTILKLFFGHSLADRPLLLLSTLLIILGIQFVTFGFLSEILIRVYYEKRKSYAIDRVME